MVNDKHDAAGYDRCGYRREITDANALYDAFRAALKGSAWKPPAQRFETNFLTEITKLQKELLDGSYEVSPTRTFTLRKRGKERNITAPAFRDRVAEHALCDEQLMPFVVPRLIYDNGASIKGKGLAFTRKRVLAHLRKFFREHGASGYALIIDFSKYYENIDHGITIAMLKTGGAAADLLTKKVVNSMPRGLNIGNQTAQVAGAYYSHRLDNFAKIVKGVKHYVRYMDDLLILGGDKNRLLDLLRDIADYAAGYGMTINRRKTHIAKLSGRWRFLQLRYTLTATGKIFTQISPKRVTAMRRKMKKLKSRLSRQEFDCWFKSWYGAHAKLMSRAQRRNIKTLKEVLQNG